MNSNKNVYSRVLDEQVNLLKEARNKLRDQLKENDLVKELSEKSDIRCGKGIKTKCNDRRMYMWIEVNYKQKEYGINLFKSEIDWQSGNCHSQIGRIMFTKGYIKNKLTPTSTNRILKDDRGEWQTDKNQTALIFNSENWIDPLTYMDGIDKTKLANGKWITVDDILNEDGIVEEIIDAFVKFLHIENQ